MKKNAALAFLVSVFYVSVAVTGFANGLGEASGPVADQQGSPAVTEFRTAYFAPPQKAAPSDTELALRDASATDASTANTAKAVDSARTPNAVRDRAGVRSARRTNAVTRATVTRRVATARRTTAPTTRPAAQTLTRAQLVAREQARANAILAGFIAKYPILTGTVVYVKDCPNNWQGCAYYTKGVILVDPDHTAPLYDIIAHEVRHILDWRTDNDIDNNDYHK